MCVCTIAPASFGQPDMVRGHAVADTDNSCTEVEQCEFAKYISLLHCLCDVVCEAHSMHPWHCNVQTARIALSAHPPVANLQLPVPAAALGHKQLAVPLLGEVGTLPPIIKPQPKSRCVGTHRLNWPVELGR